MRWCGKNLSLSSLLPISPPPTHSSLFSSSPSLLPSLLLLLHFSQLYKEKERKLVFMENILYPRCFHIRYLIWSFSHRNLYSQSLCLSLCVSVSFSVSLSIYTGVPEPKNTQIHTQLVVKPCCESQSVLPQSLVDGGGNEEVLSRTPGLDFLFSESYLPLSWLTYPFWWSTFFSSVLKRYMRSKQLKTSHVWKCPNFILTLEYLAGSTLCLFVCLESFPS